MKNEKNSTDLAAQLVDLVGEALSSCAGSGEAFEHALLPESFFFQRKRAEGLERDEERWSSRLPPVDVVDIDSFFSSLFLLPCERPGAAEPAHGFQASLSVLTW